MRLASFTATVRLLLAELLALVVALLAAAPGRAALVYQGKGAQVIAAGDDGSQARVIARGLRPVISPNGRWVAYLALDRRRVIVKPITGGPGMAIARGASDPMGAGSVRTAWSRDSRRIATLAVGQRLVVYDLSTRRSSTRVDFGEPDMDEPAFSPSGRRVAYVSSLDVSGFVGWTTSAGPRRSVALQRMGTDPVWGPRGLAILECDCSRYDQERPSFVFVVATDGGHGHRLPGSSGCSPVAWASADALLAACYGPGATARPVLLGIGRRPQPLAGGPVDRIVALAGDQRSILAQDGPAIVRIDLTTGVRQLLGVGTSPSWSG